MSKIYTDVLIIGGGSAACRAAIEAADAGARVLMISKRPPERAGATSYPVAEMAGYNAGDPAVCGDVESHYNDIINAGQGMADPNLAVVLATGAPQTVKKLEEWGVTFEQEGNGYYVFKSCFSNTPRTHVIKGHGKPIIQAMMKQISIRPQIQIADDITAAGLIMDDGCCCGAWGYTASGEKFLAHAGAVVMATGGAGQVFQRNLNPTDVTGDGYLMGYEAGAELINMEFMQMGIGFSRPVISMFNAYLWEGQPILKNANGKEFLSDYVPDGVTPQMVLHEHRRHFPFSSSDISKYLEVAIHHEITHGRCTPNGGISVDLRHMTDSYINALSDDCGIHHMWPIARDYMKKKGVDLLQNPAEVCCFAHAFNGGLRIDRNAATTVPGLYAAGEVAGGPHGADRLGGNMMVTCQVFGAIAGRNAAQYAMIHRCNDRGTPIFCEEKELLVRKSIDIDKVRKRLNSVAQRYLLVERTAEGLQQVLDVADELEKEIMTEKQDNVIHIENLALSNQIHVAKFVATTALRRTESRGSHYRADYPEKDEKQGIPFIIKQ